jgi:hypothetical protein
MDENEEFEFALALEREKAAGAALPAAKPPSLASRGMSAIKDAATEWYSNSPAVGAVELAASGASGLAAKVGAGLMGLGTMGARAAGMTDADPADVVRETQDALTYQPRSNAAKMITGGVEKAASVFDPIAEAVDSAGPGVRTFVPAVAEAVLDLAPVPLAKPAARAATPKPIPGAARPTPDDPVAAMRAAGYKLRPSDVQAITENPKTPGLWREGLQEPAQLRKDITHHNQRVSTKLANEEIGTKSLTPSEFERVRKPHFDVYDQVEAAVGTAPSTEFKAAREAALARTGFKPGANPSTTQIIAALRKQERKRARSEDVATNKEGQLDRDAADALEDALEKQLTAYGDEKLFKSYQESRKALARIHDVETATRGQQIDAQYLHRMDKRDKGRMVGRLKLIADSGAAAKNVVRHSQGATGRGSSVKAESLYQGVKNLGKAAIAKLPGMDIRGSRFQNKFGREALPEERASFADYGRRTPRPEPVPQAPPQMGAGDVEFTQTGGVTPPLANDLAGDLELLPDPVPGAQVLPEAPPMLTADVPPPVRGDIDFQPSPELLEGLAGELGLLPEQPRMPGSVDWVPPVMGDPGDLAPALGLPDELVAQLGLAVDTPQPSLMTPVADPVPFGPRVQLERPPGRVGKPRKPKK